MSLAKTIEPRVSSKIENKRIGINEQFGNPRFILDQMSEFLKEGDFSSSTDLLSAYVANSSKYTNQEAFAEAIGTTRQILHRMFAHENVSLNLFFKALEKVHEDVSEN